MSDVRDTYRGMLTDLLEELVTSGHYATRRDLGHAMGKELGSGHPLSAQTLNHLIARAESSGRFPREWVNQQLAGAARVPRSRFTPQQLAAIRRERGTRQAVSRKHGITPPQLDRIRRGLTVSR